MASDFAESRAIELAGVDLAWQSEKNPSAIAYGSLHGNDLALKGVEPAVFGIDRVLEKLTGTVGLRGISIDAPLVINNADGQRACEKGIGREYGSRKASCHTSNAKLYPHAKSVYLSTRLLESGFQHLDGEQWQIECYPHPAIIEIFGLPERLKYKKGKVAERRAGQKMLAAMIRSLEDSKTLALSIGEDCQEIFDEGRVDALVGKALKSNEDALDAVLCLYIAGLYALNADGHCFGNVHSGYIWVPQGSCL